MSELKNPLFDNERDLLERQKEEYKNALMGDVAQLKTQSQEIGKKVAIAGGVLMAGLLLSRMFGGSKKKSKKLTKEGPSAVPVGYIPPIPPEAGYQHYNPLVHEQAQGYNMPPEAIHYAPPHQGQHTGVAKSFMNSELVQMLTSQLAALLMVYLTKKVEEYLNSVSKNPDIAPIPIVVSDTEATEYYPEEDAL
ncbi:hypothetical protein [Botryobacter ruber]|uniref:hypothetical protein n=1 Tax=Botryobacter ruber TaxID=2171629 RepID=UPI000E0AB1EB|nr:hypothetical protein [Botryobacter ruber]